MPKMQEHFSAMLCLHTKKLIGPAADTPRVRVSNLRSSIKLVRMSIKVPHSSTKLPQPSAELAQSSAELPQSSIKRAR